MCCLCPVVRAGFEFPNRAKRGDGRERPIERHRESGACVAELAGDAARGECRLRRDVERRRDGVRRVSPTGKNRFQASDAGIMTSALVTDDTVYFADLAGWICALDRATGSERWKLNSRAPDFPGAHPINLFFAGPLLARKSNEVWR